MASCTDFVGCLQEGVTVNSESYGASGITNISSILKSILDFGMDNFYEGDSGSISTAIDSLKELHQAVEETNYMYEIDPSKRTLMEEILSELETFKTTKTSVDSGLLADDMHEYNSSLSTAKVGYEISELLKTIGNYNLNIHKPLIYYLKKNDNNPDEDKPDTIRHVYAVVQDEVYKVIDQSLYAGYHLTTREDDRIWIANIKDPVGSSVTGSQYGTFEAVRQDLAKKARGRGMTVNLGNFTLKTSGAYLA